MIELQHSWIDPADVTERQRFYGNMWWLFDHPPWKNFRVWLSRDGVAKYRWMTRRRTPDYVTLPFFIDIGGPVMRVERLGPQGCGSGWGTLITRAAFIEMAELRPLTDEESTATSHYVLHTTSPRNPAADDDVIVPSLELAWWAVRGGGAIMITRHDLGGRTTTETVLYR
ncbi:MAG TPA: hypothetical protein VK540_29855 [Polyangiaceae bacterium]|nr:hypothetical protein [Polyangiaceae bacterium]